MRRSEFIAALNAIELNHPDPEVFFTVSNAQHGTCELKFDQVAEGFDELVSFTPVGQELEEKGFIDVLLTIRNVK